MPHPLDNPIWSALAGRHRGLAEAAGNARRYPPAIAPFAALGEGGAAAFSDLHALLGPGGVAALCTPRPVAAPSGFAVVRTVAALQMVANPAASLPVDGAAVELRAADAPAMMELAELAKPGPFGPRAHELGGFLGVWEAGRLVAMAGERMKPDGHAELTAVCTHPDHRGRGLARRVTVAVMRQVAGRGDVPFLHVFADNAAAIGLYRAIGMDVRQPMHITVLEAGPAAA